jgi:putative nucleotidyltransferase with HDIG domain
LAAAASFWVARTLARPIDELSRSLSAIAASQRFDQRLVPSGSSQELDALARTFNDLLGSIAAAEAQTQAATVGAIKALATALDARDPYTAGHSERVSVLSVAIGRRLGMGDDELEVLRLGALLHDIGKIGVPDDVLRKAGTLTPEEFELIKLHPGLGARILKSVPFLQPHLPIVELHHERPDGKGYPHNLHRDEIPLLAGIVHVADAFDAITSARAYRSSRSPSEAVTELWRNAGADFDPGVVEALVEVLHLAPAAAAAPTIELPAGLESRVVRFARSGRAQA